MMQTLYSPFPGLPERINQWQCNSEITRMIVDPHYHDLDEWPHGYIYRCVVREHHGLYSAWMDMIMWLCTIILHVGYLNNLMHSEMLPSYLHLFFPLYKFIIILMAVCKFRKKHVILTVCLLLSE